MEVCFLNKCNIKNFNLKQKLLYEKKIVMLKKYICTQGDFKLSSKYKQ